MHQVHKTLAMMADVGSLVRRAQSLDNLFQSVCELVASLSESSASYIVTMGEAPGAVPVLAAAAGPAGNYIRAIDLSIDRDQACGCGGLFGEVFRARGSAVSDNALEDDRFCSIREILAAWNIRSAAGAALFIDQRVRGGLVVASSQPAAYASEDVALLERIGDLLALGMANLEARALGQRYHSLYAALSSVSDAVSQIPEEKALFRASVAGIAGAGPGLMAQIACQGDDGAALSVVAQSGLGGNAAGTHEPVPLTETSQVHRIIGATYRAGHCLIWDKAPKSPELQAPPASLAEVDIGSLVGVPVFVASDLRAILALGASRAAALGDDLPSFAERLGNCLRLGLIAFEQRAQLGKLLQTLEQSPSSVVITDIHGSIEYVNDSFCRETGYSRSELIGQSMRILKTGKTPAATYESLQDALTNGRPWKGEFVNRKKNGSDYIESASISAIYKPEGAISHYAAVTEDITERKELAQELDRYRTQLEELVAERTAELAAARQAAEVANDAKSAFLANMSHELRTPMNGVIGMIEVLSLSDLPAHQASLVQTIRESATTLMGIIDDILDFSKIEAGRMEVERVPVSVTDLVEGLCSSLIPVADSAGVDLHVFVSPQIPQSIISDDVRIRQLLYNLAGNAIKFSSAQPGVRGRVEVRAELDQSSPPRLLVRVIDNGIGMSAETLGKLFQPFTQAEAATTRRYGGSGLGLAICKRLAELLGGDICVDSTVGRGSCFTLRLPCEPVAGAPMRDDPDLSGLECILVHGEGHEMDDWRIYLEYAGASVRMAPDLETAVVRGALIPGVVILTRGTSEDERPEGEAQDTERAVRILRIVQPTRRHGQSDRHPRFELGASLIRREALLRAVAEASGTQVRDPTSVGAECMHPPWASISRPGNLPLNPGVVLVAEDDEVNQRVILQQLNALGYAGEVASDGETALHLWREKDYDLLLTDLHMPSMDGYMLAESIRREEGDRAHMPIVALTANALRGEARRALAAGMDQYLTKPVQLASLRAALEKWTRAPRNLSPPGVLAAPKQAVPQVRLFDVSALKRLIGDDERAVADILWQFHGSCTRLARELGTAFAAGDLRSVSGVGHKLKSASRSVGAFALGDLSAELEEAAGAMRQEDAARLMGRILEMLEVIKAEIDSLLVPQ